MKNRLHKRFRRVKEKDVVSTLLLVLDGREGEALNFAVRKGISPKEWRYILCNYMRSAEDIADTLTMQRKLAKKWRAEDAKEAKV